MSLLGGGGLLLLQLTCTLLWRSLVLVGHVLGLELVLILCWVMIP